MAVNLSPYGGVGAQFFSNNGVPLAGGKIFTYAAGTTTPQATYTSASGSTAHANPIILDAAGRVPGGEIWLTDGLQYKFVLKDANDITLATYDNVVGINSNFINYTNEQEIQTATSGQTVFTLTTMQYQPGTGSLSVFVDGVNQYGPGAQYAYVETDSTTVTFVTGLHVGASVKFTTTAINAASYGDAFQISYTPPFTGSVATNVEDKLAQYVSVKDFGAVGDGVTDDTVAIQNAIDASTGKELFFPAGNYLVTSSLIFPTSGNDVLSIALVGEQGTVVAATALTTVSFTGSGALFDLRKGTGANTNANGVRFEGLRLSGVTLTFGRYGMTAYDFQGCIIRNCVFSVFDVGFIIERYCYYCIMENISINDGLTKGCSVSIVNGTTFERCRVSAIDPAGAVLGNGIGFEVKSGGEGAAVFNGCWFEICRKAIVLENNPAANFVNCYWENNVFNIVTEGTTYTDDRYVSVVGGSISVTHNNANLHFNNNVPDVYLSVTEFVTNQVVGLTGVKLSLQSITPPNAFFRNIIAIRGTTTFPLGDFAPWLYNFTSNFWLDSTNLRLGQGTSTPAAVWSSQSNNSQILRHVYTDGVSTETHGIATGFLGNGRVYLDADINSTGTSSEVGLRLKGVQQIWADDVYAYVAKAYTATTGAAANVVIDSSSRLLRSTSSLKYKRDVQDSTHGLAEVLKLRSVTYKGKSEHDGETIFGGLIAEEVHAAGLTEFVKYADDGSPDALAYGNMVALLVKAIQEQQLQIKNLQTEIEKLKS